MDRSVKDQMLGCEKESLMSQPSDVCLLVYSACEPACLLSPGSHSAAVVASRWRSCCRFLSLSCWFSSGCWRATGCSWTVRQHAVTLCLCVGREYKHILCFTSWCGGIFLWIVCFYLLQLLPWGSVWPWLHLCDCLVSRCRACCCQASSSMMCSG